MLQGLSQDHSIAESVQLHFDGLQGRIFHHLSGLLQQCLGTLMVIFFSFI